MTYSRFILRNALRNKRRTALTVLSVAFSLFLLITLYTLLDSIMNPPEGDETALRLAVRRSTSLADDMPIAYEQKIATVPGIELLLPLQWFGGYYKEPKNFFANFATDPHRLWDMFPELHVTEEIEQAMLADRRAAVAGRGLMERYGWKVGDRVTLKGTIYPVDLEFILVGEYLSDRNESNFYFRFDYLDEALGNPGRIGSFWVKAESAEKVPEVADAIDALFRNTPAETKTETEKAFMLGFVSMLGNIQAIIGSVAIVIGFTMLLVASSTMAMTIRERLREIAILKSMGYPPHTLLMIILGEAMLISVFGGLMACGGAFALRFADVYSMTMGFVERFDASPALFAMTLVVGAGIGLVAGLVPALQASWMTISEALRRLE